MKIYTLAYIITFILLGAEAMAQPANVSIKKDTLIYYIQDIPVTNITYLVENRSKETIWLWLAKENFYQKSDSLKIREYFKKRKKGTDFSFYELIADGNVESFTSDLFNFFIKVIKPDEFFTMEIVATKTSARDIISIFDTYIYIMPESKIRRWISGIEGESVINQFSFKSTIIAIPWQLLE